MEPNIFEAGPDAIRDAVDEQVSWMFPMPKRSAPVMCQRA